jgi:hypothetical protein
MAEKTLPTRSVSRIGTVLVAGFILFGTSGCAVVTVAGAAVGVAATVAGTAVDVAVGTVKVTAKAGSAVVGAIAGGEE